METPLSIHPSIRPSHHHTAFVTASVRPTEAKEDDGDAAVVNVVALAMTGNPKDSDEPSYLRKEIFTTTVIGRS